MLATRPSSSQQEAAAAAAAAASSSAEEKNIPGVSKDALKEERKPLLDLDDVEQFESELAACFDAPPPPPLNIRLEEPIASVSSWTPAAEPRYVETVVAPPTPAEVAAAQARGEMPRPQQEEEQEQREREQQQQQQTTRVSDLSSLYTATPHRGESVGQLYPALVPSAPSSEAMRIPQPHAAPASAAPAAAAAAVSSATVPVPAASAGLEAVRVAREKGEELGSSSEVVDELLSENERLRIIIQEMSEELDRASVRAGGGATAAAAGARQAPSQAQRVATTSATPAQRLLGRYPGAQAEAARRQREREQQQQPQSQQQQGQTETEPQRQTLENLRPGQFVHFKCDNCPQWLKVPGHAQLVYCPSCGHTSQMTSSSTIHVPPNSETQSNGGRGSGAGGTSSGQEEEVGWIGYFKSIIAS
eukprot:g13887.t1